MKKPSLLGAAALTTFAVAGAAQAGTLTLGSVTGANIKGRVQVASEVKLDATNGAGVIGAFLVPSKEAILPVGNALLTVSLTGGATFGKAVTAGAVVTNGNCAPTTTVSSGGKATDSSVVFLISELNKCKSADGVDSTDAIAIAIPVLAAGSNVNIETNLTTEQKSAIDGGTATSYDATAGAGSKDLINFSKAFKVTTTADTTATAATVASKFTKLTTNVALGTVKIEADTTLQKGVTTGAAKIANGDVKAATFTIAGDLVTSNLVVSGTGFSANKLYDSKTSKQTTDGAAGSAVTTFTFNAATVTGNPVITGSAYTVTTALDLDPAVFTAQSYGPSDLQPITREGASYLLPWVASGALSTKSTSNTVVRLVNDSKVDTGAVSIELLTSSTGVAPSTTLIPVATSIPAGKELILDSSTLQSYVGSDFGRGDIRISVEGQASQLIVRRFVQSTTTGALSEVSLGRTSAGSQN